MDNRILRVGLKYKSDKITHHEYHDIYHMYLKDWYDKDGAMIEIGVEGGRSMSMWPEVFPNSNIYGMDIDLKCEWFEGERQELTERNKLIQGDQSNEKDLENLCNKVRHENVFFINDDGSHIPEHQLLTFNRLFPLLCEGGIYIIEDIEVSYWKNGNLYGYEANYGYKNPKSIIEIFKEVADSVNFEFSKQTNGKVMHYDKIGSITFSKNCIIIVKKTQVHQEYIWEHFL